jgi:cytochrome P450
VRIAPDHADIAAVSARKEIYNVREVYVKSSWYIRIVPPGNKSMFTTNDIEFHRRHRRLLSAGLTEASLRMIEPSIMRNVELCIRRMGEEMEKRGVVDIYKWFIFMTTDVIGELSYGESFHMLKSGKVS